MATKYFEISEQMVHRGDVSARTVEAARAGKSGAFGGGMLF